MQLRLQKTLARLLLIASACAFLLPPSAANVFADPPAAELSPEDEAIAADNDDEDADWPVTGGAASRIQQTSLAPAEKVQIAALIKQLDAPSFAPRQHAAQQLAKLVRRPELARAMSHELQQAVSAAQASLEVRSQLADLLRGLPKNDAGIEEPEASAAEFEELLDRFDDDSYIRRLSAAHRLRTLLRKPALICPIMLAAKRRLDDPTQSAEAKHELRPLLDRARSAWLVSDPKSWKLPPVSNEQIQGWVDLLAGNSADASGREQQAAHRELLDALVRDEYRNAVQKSLRKAIADTKDAAALGRLGRLHDLSQPAMVAEAWENHRHVTVQHLLVDVPQVPEGAPQATHFDRIDDQTAHCVSGNTLRPGDYPVGVAIPHPGGRSVLFHLINLPTPRRRLTYEYQMQGSEKRRLAELSQRTVDDMLAKKRHLDELELAMLGQLDQHVLSRFVGAYIEAVPDRPLVRSTFRLNSQASEHAGLCEVLAACGTHEAIPALDRLDGTLEAPSDEAPYRIALAAALAIANRDPWKEVDAWLAGLLPRGELLRVGDDDAAQIAATAAAQLLSRHEVSPSRFGLEPVTDTFLQGIGLGGYRFSDPEKRAEVIAWWNRRKQELDKLPSS